MSDTKQPEWRDGLRLFRDRMGGLTDARKAYLKEDRETRKAIREALKAEPKTIPDLSRQLSLPSEKTMWYVMALKRYGEVVESSRAGDYYRYALKETVR